MPKSMRSKLDRNRRYGMRCSQAYTLVGKAKMESKASWTRTGEGRTLPKILDNATRRMVPGYTLQDREINGEIVRVRYMPIKALTVIRSRPSSGLGQGGIRKNKVAQAWNDKNVVQS